MKIVAIIEARMGSSRLPGKTLVPIIGRPMLALLVERLQRVPELDQIVIATTTATEDFQIEQLARRLEVGCFRGSSDDVLDRVLKAAMKHKADLIVEITGDCPLIDPDVTSETIRSFLAGEFDYFSNNLVRTYPRGLDTQVFPTRILADVASRTNDPADREHVSLYIYEHPERYRLGHSLAPDRVRRPDLRLTVDTPEDLAMVRAIYESLYPADPEFTVFDIVDFLDAHPELMSLNANVRQKPVRT